eukprot:EG_transcript_26350
MAHYADLAYWDQRYKCNPQPFEWYQPYSCLHPRISRCLRAGAKVLILGCGTSTLGEELYDAGNVAEVVCIDFSGYAVEAMEARRGIRKNLTYTNMDAQSLAYPADHFDMVIDKATLDSILCGPDEDRGYQTVSKALAEAYRVLKRGGYFVHLSCTQEGREDLLNLPHGKWKVDHFVILQDGSPAGSEASAKDKDDPNCHHLFLCRKG